MPLLLLSTRYFGRGGMDYGLTYAPALNKATSYSIANASTAEKYIAVGLSGAAIYGSWKAFFAKKNREFELLKNSLNPEE